MSFRNDWLAQSRDIFRKLDLPFEVAPASDPFFGRAAPIMERGQKEQELKYEVLVTINDDRSLTACVSANGHRDHFSKALGIMRGDGATVHSACAGFGLARMALALLRWHGPSMSTWPSSARAFLGDPGFGSCRGR